jgi:hypothetical protein
MVRRQMESHGPDDRDGSVLRIDDRVMVPAEE